MNLRPGAFGVLLLLLAACSGRKETPAEDAKPTAAVHTAPVQAGEIPEVVTAYGAAETTTGSERSVAAAADSTVTAILVAVGDPVRAGQPVARLSPSATVALDLTKAARDVSTAQAALARALRLRAGGLVSDAEVETARAAAGTASATVRNLRARLPDVLRAPISGVVLTLPLAPGAFAPVGTAVATLGSVTGTRMRLGLDAADVGRVHVGDSVRLAAMSGDRQANSRVLAVDPRADPQTRQASVYAQSPPGDAFPAGQAVKGEITVARRAGVAVVPKSAVLYEGDTPYLFVVQGGVAHRRDLLLGAETPDRVEVRRGVSPGDRIALDGGTALSDGMAVREEPMAR